MSFSHITISPNSDTKSVGSSTSLMILSDTRATPDSDTKSSEAPPSPEYVPATPDYFPGSDPEESPKEDDSTGDDTSKTVGLERLLSGLWRHHHYHRVLEYSSSLSGSSSSAPSLPYFGPSCRRSRYVSSSSETSHPSSSPSPRKRRRVLVYSSPSSTSLPTSPSAGPSRKRCRSPASPLPIVEALSTPAIEMLPPRKRFRGTSFAPQEDVHVETTVEAGLDDYKTLRARVVSSKREIDSLLVGATTANHMDEIARDGISKLEDRLRYTEYWIQQGELAKVNNRVRIKRIEQRLGM
ncbi:hypothetical protein Tco_0981821 [Tanacetum coccineum]